MSKVHLDLMSGTAVTSASARDLLLDCDGVLLDWLGGFIRFAEHVLKKKLDPNGPSDFNLSGWLGVSQEKMLGLIDAFNSGEDGYFGELQPLPGAVEALQAAHAQGRILSIITACANTPSVIAQREQNLVNVFGKIFGDIHAVGMKESKSTLLKSYDNVIWIEDKMENAVMGAEIGHPTYLIRASHNAKYDGNVSHDLMTWVDGWDCIRKFESLH